MTITALEHATRMLHIATVFCFMLLFRAVRGAGARMRPVTHLSLSLQQQPTSSSSSSSPPSKDSSKYSLKQGEEVTMKSAYLHGLFVFNTNLIPEPEQSARYLLSDVIGIHTFKYSDFFNSLNDERQLQLSAQQVERFNSHVASRMNRVPIQYIIGNWDFYGQTYLLASPVLIPRPETEEMVEIILGRHKKAIISSVCGGVDGKSVFNILDIGSGSGVIGISLLHELRELTDSTQKQLIAEQVTCSAIDINERAVQLSRSNAVRVLGEAGRGYSCQHTGVREYVDDSRNHKSFDLIVSNPPYIPEAEMAALAPEVARYEDRAALCGGSDGTSRRLVPSSRRLSSSHRHPRSLCHHAFFTIIIIIIIFCVVFVISLLVYYPFFP